MAGDNIFDSAEGEEEILETTETETTPAAEAEQQQTDNPEVQDDLFAFLDNDAGADEEEAEPLPELDAAPSHPPVPAPPTAMDRMAEQMASFLERQAAPAVQQAPAAPVYVDPFERPENVAILADLEERAIFDVDAARQLRVLERKLDRESNDYRLNQALGQERSRLTGLTTLQSQRDEAFTSLKAAAPYVDRGSYDTAEAAFIKDVFGGDMAAYASAASQPLIRQQIANNAELAAIKGRAAGRASPTAKPSTTARPAATAATAKPAAAKANGAQGRSYSAIETRLADDADYESEISARAFGIGKRK